MSRMIRLKTACELLGASYKHVESKYVMEGRVHTERDGALHYVHLENLKKELLEQGVRMTKDPETDLITLPEAAELLGLDPYRLSQLAYEKRITTERHGGAKYLVRLATLREQLKNLPPKKAYPTHSERLTPAQRQEIARLYATGNFTYKQLAEQFRVSQHTIRNCFKKYEEDIAPE